MKQHYTKSFLTAALLLAVPGWGMGQCLTNMTTPAGQTPEIQTFGGSVTAGNANITITAPTTGTAGMAVGMVLSSTPALFAPGTVITGIAGNVITVAPPPIASSATPTIWANNWGAATIPPNTTHTRLGSVDAGGNTITFGGCPLAWLVPGTGITGPGIPPGTTITGLISGCTFGLSNTSTPSGSTNYTLTLPPPPYNFPPPVAGTPSGLHCSVCPATFTTTICAGQYFDYYMCVGNNYTFSMCGNPNWNSTITITTTAGTVAATGFPTYDNDGCGTANGHAVVNFIPTSTGIYRVRLFDNPCVVNAGLCGSIQVQCSPNPAPPSNDEPQGAVSLPVSTACNFVPATNAFSTGSAAAVTGSFTPNITPQFCGAGCSAGSGSYAGADVWFSAVTSPTGTLSVQTNLVSAQNLSMAIYTGTPGVSLTQIGGPTYCNSCNDDAAAGVLAPFLQVSGLAPSSTVYIRVWSNSGLINSGSFQICAYHPVPPPNDDPCGAISLPINTSCNLTSFTTESALPLSVAMTLSPATPTCGTPVAGGDVWFSTTVPAGQSVTINTQAGSLNNMAMAVYTLTGGTICAGTLTQGLCNDDFGASLMPSITLPAPGVTTTYYIRLWNKTTTFGTASICVVQNVPPPNDQPCGAINLPVNLGCTFPAPYSTQFATVTGTTAPNVVSIQNPTCNPGPYNSDVWFTATVPANGQLSIDTDDMQMNDGAIAVYSATGSCGGGDLALTQIASACAVAGSANGAQMPALNLTGLTPGATVYIRVWRQTGNDGNFLICARNPQTPSGCWYTLRLNDSAGDGWNGGFVTLCINGSCTNYTVYGSLSTIVFTANIGDLVTLSYTAVGGFQNQVSWTLSASNGSNIWTSPSTPSTGPQHTMTVNAACNVPPAPISDCVGAQVICNNQSISFNPSNTGNVADLNSSNDGCLAGEQQGTWFVFTTNAAGTIAFTLGVPVGTDYDFAVWGPYPPGSPPCPPPGPPLRCNWSATTGPTGLSTTSFTPSVGAVGSPFSQWIAAGANQQYILYVDNWSRNGIAFNLTWQNSPANILDCILPVELVEFDAYALGGAAQLRWSTATEQKLSHFVIERSADGERFSDIGQVAALGNRNTLTEYHGRDAEPMMGVNHYRLRMVDEDGTFQHSKVVPVRFGWSPASVQVYPNPAGHSLWVAAQELEEGWQWRIVDASGRTVRDGRVQAGSAPFEITLAIESGAYLLEVLDERGTTMGHARFVKD